MRRILCRIILLVLFCTSCTSESPIGQYVYVDGFLAIHIDRECASKLSDNLKTKEERIAKMRGVTFVDTTNLTSMWTREDGFEELYGYCPRCINDVTYATLSNIMKRNDKYHNYRHRIYDELCKDYQMEPYNEFIDIIKNPEKRKKLYEIMRSGDYDIESSYDEFSESLGFPSIQLQ